VKKIAGNVLRRGIIRLEERDVVEIVMIQFLQQAASDLFHFTEIHQDPALIKVCSPQDNFHLPVVAVKALALPSEIPQMMGRGKVTDDLHLVNGLIHV